MKTRILIAFMLVPMLAFAQIKGKKSKEPFTSSKGTTYKIGQIIKLGKPSNGDKFAYAYVKKGGFGLGDIAKIAKSVNDVKNLNVSNVQSIANSVKQVNEIANSELVSSAMNQLMGQAVSESYVAENALAAGMEGTKYKIKKFKVYTDKDTGDKIVHAIAKGSGKTIAVLLEFAERTGELGE